MPSYRLIFLFLSCHQFLLGSADEESSNLDFVYDRMESYNGTNEYYKYKVDIAKADDGTFKVNGEMDLLQDFGDEYQMSVEIFKMNENKEYESLFRLPVMSTCSFQKSMYRQFLYPTLSKYSNLPHYDVCPVPKGKYEIKEMPFDTKPFQKMGAQLGFGSYRINCFLIQNDVAISGGMIYSSIVEKS